MFLRLFVSSFDLVYTLLPFDDASSAYLVRVLSTLSLHFLAALLISVETSQVPQVCFPQSFVVVINVY